MFTGYGGLDRAVREAHGGHVVWHCEWEPPSKQNHYRPHQAAAKVLVHRWPDIPNLGDVTRIDWTTVPPVDIVTAGFPCQDLSLAGVGAGMAPGTRSGLWYVVAEAVAVLRPSLLVIENVRGLLSAPAAGHLEPCPWCLGDDPGSPLRALGAVLGDLAALGFDAEWESVRASDIGLAHERFRVFLEAWPAGHPDGVDSEGGNAVNIQRTSRPPSGHRATPDPDGP